MTYRYSINGYLVTPIFTDDLTKDYEMESGQRFFRAKLTGKIAFIREDYDWLDAQAFDTDFIFLVERLVGSEWTEYWQGIFSKTDCKWNDDDKKVDVTMNPYDDYKDVIAGLEKEYNIIELGIETESLIIQKRPLIQVYIPGDNTISCFLGGSYWEQDCTEITNETDLANTYKFIKTNQLLIYEISGTFTPVDILSAYAGEVGSNIVGNAGYKMTYSASTVGGVTTYKYFIQRLSDSQNMFESEGLGAPLGSPFTMLPVAGSGATGSITATGFLISVFMRYLLDVELWGTTATYPIPANDIVENNRNYKRVIPYYFDLAFTTARFSTTPTPYGRNDYGYFMAPYSIANDKYYPIGRTHWGNASIWFAYYALDYLVEQKGRQAYKLKDAYTLSGVIKALLAEVAPTITHEATTEYSNFLYAATNPISSQAFTLMLTQKTNITVGEYDKPAQKAPLTFAELMGMLRDVFRCYWYIEDNKLKIEHIHWFMNGGSYSGTPTIAIDLTTAVEARTSKKWGFNTSAYEFDKATLPERKQYKWMDDVTSGFEGMPIEILSKYITKGNIDNTQLTKFTSDIDYMMLNPTEISPDGFALFAAIKLNLFVINDTEIMEGYKMEGGAFVADVNYNVTGKMPVIGGDTYEMSYFKNVYWYTANGTYISRVDSSTSLTHVAPPTAGFARTTVAVASWSAYYFRNTIKSLPFVYKTVENVEYLLQNGYLAWPVLHPIYHVYDLPARSVRINNDEFTAFGIIKSKKQQVEFPTDEDPSTFGLIKTYLGNGQIEKISVNLSSGLNKITLKYDTE